MIVKSSPFRQGLSPWKCLMQRSGLLFILSFQQDILSISDGVGGGKLAVNKTHASLVWSFHSHLDT